MDRKPTPSEVTTECRQAAKPADSSRYDAFREEADSGYMSWNSWGERNPLALGSYGRW